MRLESDLSVKDYLAGIVRHMDAFTSFGDERFTGFVKGSFFSIVYHSGYEWNRRITNEKNRAIGYVRQNPNGEGCQVRFIRLRGLTNPLSLIFMFLAVYVFGWIVGFWKGFLGDPQLWNGICVGVAAFFSVWIAVFTAVEARMTERGRYGRMVLMALLRHPENPYDHLDYSDQT